MTNFNFIRKIICSCLSIFSLVEKLKNLKEYYVLMISSVFDNLSTIVSNYNNSFNKYMKPNNEKSKLILRLIVLMNEAKLEYFNYRLNIYYINPGNKNILDSYGNENQLEPDYEKCSIDELYTDHLKHKNNNIHLIAIEKLKLGKISPELSLVNFEELYLYQIYFFKNNYNMLRCLDYNRDNFSRKTSFDSFKLHSKVNQKKCKKMNLFQFKASLNNKLIDKSLKFYFDVALITIKRDYFSSNSTVNQVCRICEESYSIKNFISHIYFCFEKKVSLKLLRKIKNNLKTVYKTSISYIDLVEKEIKNECNIYINLILRS